MDYTQDTRRLNLQTPLGENILLIRSIDGTEAISQLYNYQIEAMAELSAKVDFSKLLGQTVVVAVALSQGVDRYIHGIVHRISRGESSTSATAYRLEIGPAIWPLTKRVQSRIFQQLSVPDILKKVLAGIDCNYQIAGTFEPREYCVQYHESDFQFFSRLCEEEGIYYFFLHEETGCKLVLANTTQSHPTLPHMSTIRYHPQSNIASEIIFVWEKVQSLRSGKITLWDHHHQLPGKNLEATQTVQPSVSVGSETNRLDIACGDLEQYHFLGGYAEHFDGVNKSGGDQAAALQKIFQDNARVAGIRMQQESVDALVLSGHTDFPGMMPGHRFTFAEHPTDSGVYVITESSTFIPQAGAYVSGGGDEDGIPTHVTFACIPLELPYRPQQFTAKPVISGSQTAYVVGPPGEEIFVDKFGRVKVSFHWDRDSKANESSSCWIRVSQGVAGKQWGTFWVPRIGQEVIVSFIEGDPDRPIITGAVYNADCMPPYALPDNKTRSSIKSNSTPGGGGSNEIRLDDTKGKEQMFIHAEYDVDMRVKNDYMQMVLNDQHLIVVNDLIEEVRGDTHATLKGDRATEITGSDSLKIGADQDVKITTKYAVDSGQEIHLKAGMKMILEAGTQLSLKVGGNFIDIGPGGVFIKGMAVMINSGGSAGSGSGASPDKPKAPKEAANDKAGQSTVPNPRSYQSPGPQALVFRRAALAGSAFCDI